MVQASQCPCVPTVAWSCESILSRGSVVVSIDIEQRLKGITMYFYIFIQHFSRIGGLEIKQTLFVYTRFGFTFRSVSVLVPIFRKYPLSRWWICLVSDPSPKLHCVPVWMDELNPRLRSFHQVTRILYSSTFIVSSDAWRCVLLQQLSTSELCDELFHIAVFVVILRRNLSLFE